MPRSRKSKSYASRFGLLMEIIFLMWLVFFLDAALQLGLARFGILPRQPEGLIGVFCAPFLHGNLAHLTGNTTSLLLFGGMISLRNPRVFVRLTFFGMLVTGLGVWLFARPSIHIGASGLVFAYFGYVFTIGFFERKFWSIVLSILVMALFGGVLLGVLPTDERISWEGHLAGLLAGLWFARNAPRR